MSKIPTAEKFFEQHIQRGVNNTHSNYLNTAIEFAKFHVEAALKNASGKVELSPELYDFISDFWESSEWFDKDSILNAYPLKNVK